MRVLFTTNIPSPYRVDFFNELGTQCDLTVLFESNVDKSRDKRWKSKQIKNFKAMYLNGIKIGDADAFCPSIIKYLNHKQFDIIVIGAYHTPTGLLAIQYLKLRKIPFILSTDGGMIQEDSKFKYNFKKYFISAATMWLSTGQETSKYLKHYGACSEKIFVYPFTSIKEADILTKPITDLEKKMYREKLGIKEDRIVLSVGQFINRKGYDVLLNACASLQKDIGIYIIGGQPTEEYLSLKKDLNLDNVHFIDFKPKSDLAEYYLAADVFVLPTKWDIWGLVINEAISYGVPVITTNRCVSGIELICDKEIGSIIPIDNPEILTEKIIEYTSDMSPANSHRILDLARKYTIEQMARVHVEYFNILEKGL